MEDDRFDALARSVALFSSRRRLIKAAAGGLVSAAVAAVADRPAVLAYTRCRLPNGRRGRLCNGVCTDIKNDENHCGGCQRVCSRDTFCCNGWCADPAQNELGCCPPSISCDGVCTSPYSDRDNCGGCGTTCDGTEECCDGQCLRRGTEQNCDACGTCAWGGDWFCNPTLYGDNSPGCDCHTDNCPLG
jgi:hypothetical protein